MPVNEAPYETDLPDVKRIRNFRNGGAQWILAPFDGIPDEALFAININHAAPPVTCQLREQAGADRRVLQQAIGLEFSNAIYRGQFEYVLRWADELTRMFDDPMLSPFTVGGVVQHTRAVLFHSHGLLFAPGFTKDQIRAKLQRHYVGSDRVCVRNITETFVDADGIERGGRWGWAQYASKEFVKLDFGDENIDAFQEILALERTWNRHSRKIKFGGHSKADFRPTWKAERLPDAATLFMEVACDEGWTNPDHPNFDLVMYVPGAEEFPVLDEVASLPEAPKEQPHHQALLNDDLTEVAVEHNNRNRHASRLPSRNMVLPLAISTIRTLLNVLLGLCRQATSACLNDCVRAFVLVSVSCCTNCFGRNVRHVWTIALNSLGRIRTVWNSCTSMPRNNGPP